jgi:hypothetical protein
LERPLSPVAAALPPLALLGAAVVAIAVVRRGPAWLAWGALGAILAAALGWVFVSVLWPGRADRTCPACGAVSVERLDPRSLVGRRCTACAWRDTTESAWMIAEEEVDALEPLVLRQRSAVDSPPAAD